MMLSSGFCEYATVALQKTKFVIFVVRFSLLSKNNYEVTISPVKNYITEKKRIVLYQLAHFYVGLRLGLG